MIHRVAKWIERFRRIEHRSRPHSTTLCQTLTRLDHHPLTNSNLSNELPSIHAYQPGFFFSDASLTYLWGPASLSSKRNGLKDACPRCEHGALSPSFRFKSIATKPHEFEASSSNLATSWRHGSKSRARPFLESLGVAKMK